MTPAELDACARRHLRLGWTCLALFLAMGALLEALHGFKVAWYVAPAGATRRLLWTLAHAHGTLLGLVNVAFAFTLRALPGAGWRPIESWCLRAGSVLLPVGFVAGGLFVYGGDPGLGVAFVPPGALLLITGAALAARRVRAAGG
jgi:hypothetical protein